MVAKEGHVDRVKSLLDEVYITIKDNKGVILPIV